MSPAGRKLLIVVPVVLVLGTGLLWLRLGHAQENGRRPAVAARRLKVRVWEAGAVTPNVSVNIPVALVSATLKVMRHTGILDQVLLHAGQRCHEVPPIRIRAREIDALWSQVASAGAADLVTVEGVDGTRVEIQIE